MSKILIVEDNEMNRDMLSRRLERKGFDVVMAEDGKKCVTLKSDWAKGYTRLGLAQFFLKKYDEAEATYKKGLTLAPEDKALKEGLDKVITAKMNAKINAQSGGIISRNTVEICTVGK